MRPRRECRAIRKHDHHVAFEEAVDDPQGDAAHEQEAADGQAGVAQATTERPDLILMDIQMPVLDGYEATWQIKADPDLKATPIIAVSSFAMKGDEETARAAGCDHYVTKPYSPLQLLRLIKSLLGE